MNVQGDRFEAYFGLSDAPTPTTSTLKTTHYESNKHQALSIHD